MATINATCTNPVDAQYGTILYLEFGASLMDTPDVPCPEIPDWALYQLWPRGQGN